MSQLIEVKNVLIAFAQSALPDVDVYMDSIEDLAERMGLKPISSVYCLEYDSSMWNSEGELDMIREQFFWCVWIGGIVWTPRINEVCRVAHECYVPIYNAVDEKYPLYKQVQWFTDAQQKQITQAIYA